LPEVETTIAAGHGETVRSAGPDALLSRRASTVRIHLLAAANSFTTASSAIRSMR
jgi:hypothetical protein